MPVTTRFAQPRLHRLVVAGGGLLGVAALAGCAPSPAASSDSAAPSSSAASAPASSAASASSGTAAGGLKDGSYTAAGDYQSPGGLSSIDVTVTLKSGTITAVKVVPKASNGTARQYEAQFASGIGAVAVGKPIEGLQVGAVSGSSLTGQGFEKALQTIQQQAAA